MSPWVRPAAPRLAEKVELKQLVDEFAHAFGAADSLGPQAVSLRSGKSYQAGLGPHGENAAVRLVLAQMVTASPGVYDSARPVPYPGSRLVCDLGVGEPLEWAIEVKMVRALRRQREARRHIPARGPFPVRRGPQRSERRLQAKELVVWLPKGSLDLRLRLQQEAT